MWNSDKIQRILNQHNIQKSTSVYIYDREIFRKKILQIKENFPEWNILYSMKANPNKQILLKAAEENLGIDAASKNEVKSAYECGYSSDIIYYSAPGKTIEDLEFSYDKCIIIADSLNEIKRIINISEQKVCPINIGVRVNIANTNIEGNAFEVMAGVTTKFGMSPKEVESAITLCQDTMVSIVGIHIYFGSQILDEQVITNNLLQISSYSIKLNQRNNLLFVNFGGGFGVPYQDGDKTLNINKISNNPELKCNIKFLSQQGIKCNIELGRFLIAESGVFIASVADIKTVYDKKYVILSAGINSFFRPVFTSQLHKLEKLDVKKNSCNKEKVTIVGNLCTPLDQYYDDYLIDKLEIGDRVWFNNAGAYGLSMSLLKFISHEQPLEIVI